MITSMGVLRLDQVLQQAVASLDAACGAQQAQWLCHPLPINPVFERTPVQSTK